MIIMISTIVPTRFSIYKIAYILGKSFTIILFIFKVVTRFLCPPKKLCHSPKQIPAYEARRRGGIRTRFIFFSFELKTCGKITRSEVSVS